MTISVTKADPKKPNQEKPDRVTSSSAKLHPGKQAASKPTSVKPDASKAGKGGGRKPGFV